MDVIKGNVMPVQSVENKVKSLWGPQSLDKMLGDELGEVVIINDGATILKILSILSIEHSSAKILGWFSSGDVTTSVVKFLWRDTQFIKNKVHSITIIFWYRLYLKEAIKHINDLIITINKKDTPLLKKIAETSLSSILIWPEIKFYNEIIDNAINNVKAYLGNTFS